MPPPTETVTLRNLTRQMLPPIHLGHGEVCAIRGECLCQQVRVGVQKRGADGERALVEETRRLPSTLTLCARGTHGDTLTGLPLEVLHAPEIQRLVAARLVEIERVPVASAAPASPPPEPESEPAGATPARATTQEPS